ncbi:MAG: hypothetical protein KAS96_03995 [Planctomycetes bacterium]|nr:hypothetical protein [Planctomycetota bacterium]
MKQVAAFLISAVLLLFCNLSFAIEGDITGDSTIDFNDLALIAQSWTQSFTVGDGNSADITGDGSVNFDDYAIVAKNWMESEYTGPIGWWKLNDAAGVIATDSSPYNNNATLIGNPQWRNDPNQSWCLEFDGYGDYLSVTNKSAFDITGHITISAWIKTVAGSDDAFFAVTKGNSYMLYKDMGANYVTFLCEGLERPVNGTININDGKWHHIVGVYDGTAKYIYVDGQLDATKSSSGSIITNDLNVRIGSHELVANSQCKGRIDDVRIFSRALSLAEINSLPDEKPKQAAAPWPGDNAPWASHDVILRWSAGFAAQNQDLYFGTDYQQVTDANSSSSEFKGNLPADVNSYDPMGPTGYLTPDITYYWRIDSNDGIETTTGKTWSFTVGTSLYLNLTAFPFDLASSSIEYDSAYETGAVFCLQGLINRDGPRLFVNGGKIIRTFYGADLKWKEYLETSKGYTFTEISNFRELIQFAKDNNYIDGLVLYNFTNVKDENQEYYIAENICSMENLLPVTQTMLDYDSPCLKDYGTIDCFAGLPIVHDIRNDWATVIEARRYMINEQMPNYRKDAAFKDGGAYERWSSTDFAIERQIFIYDMNPASVVAEEVTMFDKVMAHLKPVSPVFGLWHGEGEDVVQITYGGNYSIGTAASTNLSFWDNVGADPCNMNLRQPTNNMVLDPTKYYVLFQGSDGDHMRCITSFMSASGSNGAWLKSYRGMSPMNWSFAPEMVNFWPGFVEYYKVTASPKDGFFCGPNGAGYTNPEYFPDLPAFAAHTDKYLKATGIQAAEIWCHYLPSMLEIYSQYCPSMKLFTNKRQGDSEYAINDWLSNNVPITRCSPTTWHQGTWGSSTVTNLEAFKTNGSVYYKEPPFFITFYDTPYCSLYNSYYCDYRNYLSNDFVVVNIEDFIDLMNQAYIYFNSK